MSEPFPEATRLPSGWTPLQLLKHLPHVERRWLARHLGQLDVVVELATGLSEE